MPDSHPKLTAKLEFFVTYYWFWLLAALLVFGLNLNSYFVSDDFDFLRNVAGNPHPWWWWLFHPQNTGILFYRPLHNWYFLLHHWLFGLNSWPYHLTLIIGHSLVSYLLYRSLRLIKSLTPSLAAVAALFFLVAPVHAESVAWISGGVSVLSGLPALFSLYAWLKARQTSNYWWWLVAAGSWFISLLAKESTITWPIILLLADKLLVSQQNFWPWLKSLARPLFYFGLVAAGYLIWRYLALGVMLGGYGAVVHANLDLSYLAKMVSSSVIVFFTEGNFKYWLIQYIYEFQAWFFVALAGLLALGSLAVKQYAKVYWFGCLVFVLALLPQINLGINILNSEGERYLYLPAIGAALVITSLLLSINKRTIRLVLIGLLLIGSLSLLMTRLGHWRMAGTYTKKTVEQFAPYAKDSLTHEQVFIGLPDNYRGAFIFRNGLNEALLLNYPNFKASSWGTPVGSFLSGQEINWQYRKGEIIGQSSKLTFMPIKSIPSFDYELLNEQMIESRYNFSLASGYRLRPTQIFNDLIKGRPVQFFAFNENGLVLLERETEN